MIQLYFFTCALCSFTLWNWCTIEGRKKGVAHFPQQVIRSCVWAFFAMVFEDNWPDRLMYFVSYHFAFWLPFDTLLNLFRGKAWNYIGDPSDPEEDSWIDNLSLQWPAAAMGLKIILFLIGMGTLVFGTAW